MIIRTKNGIREALALTPVLRELKRRSPNEKVLVETTYPDVFSNNPFVDEVVEYGPCGQMVNLDMYSAMKANSHFIDLFARVILGDTRIMKRAYEVFLTDEELEEGKEVVNGMSNIAAVCFDNDFHMDEEVLNEVVQQLDDWGFEAAFLDEMNLPLRKALAAIYNCSIYIGLDDDLSSIAMASKVPMVVGYTYRNPSMVRPFRRGIPFVPVTAPQTRCNLIEVCERQNSISEFGVTYGLRCTNEDKFICARHTIQQWTDAIAEVTME